MFPQNWLDRYSYDRDPQYDYTIPQIPPERAAYNYTIPQIPPGPPGLEAAAMGNPDQFELAAPAMGNPDQFELGQFPGDMGPSLPATEDPMMGWRLNSAPVDLKSISSKDLGVPYNYTIPQAPPAKTQEDPAKKQEDPASSVQALLKSMADQEKKRRQLEMFRGISSGLNKAGAALATTAGGIMSGYVPQAQTDEGLQRQQGMLENEVPESLLDTYNKIYFPKSYDENGELIPGQPTFPQGTTMSQIKGLSGMASGRGSSERQDRIDKRQANYLNLKISQHESAILDKAYDKFTADVFNRRLVNSGYLSTVVKDLLESRSSSADKSVFALFPRLFLEVGNLSETDIGLHQDRLGAWNRTLDEISKAGGNISEEQRAELLATVKLMSKSASAALNRRRLSLIKARSESHPGLEDKLKKVLSGSFLDGPDSEFVMDIRKLEMASNDGKTNKAGSFNPSAWLSEGESSDEPAAGGSSDTGHGEGGAPEGGLSSQRPTADEPPRDGHLWVKVGGEWGDAPIEDIRENPHEFEEVIEAAEAPF